LNGGHGSDPPRGGLLVADVAFFAGGRGHDLTGDAFRDAELLQSILKMTRDSGIHGSFATNLLINRFDHLEIPLCELYPQVDVKLSTEGITKG
jgi:hypothetical protein